MEQKSKPAFAPELYIKSGVTDIDFYTKALGAVELRRITNEDGSIHVAELSVNGSVFHLHEETSDTALTSPEHKNATTVIIGLFVEDVDAYMNSSIAAGATELSPAQDYDYGYRQGRIKDPFGHFWMFQTEIKS